MISSAKAHSIMPNMQILLLERPKRIPSMAPHNSDKTLGTFKSARTQEQTATVQLGENPKVGNKSVNNLQYKKPLQSKQRPHSKRWPWPKPKVPCGGLLNHVLHSSMGWRPDKLLLASRKHVTHRCNAQNAYLPSNGRFMKNLPRYLEGIAGRDFVDVSVCCSSEATN